MKFKGKPPATNHSKSVPAAHYKRVVLMLVAFCCLSVGAAIGAIASGIAVANREVNRLMIGHCPATPDSLSAAFVCVSEAVEPSVVHIKVYESKVDQYVGSGFIVSQSGFIVTNQHVTGHALRIKVKLASGNEYDAKVIGQDSETDLAVIKIEAREPLIAANIGDSDKLKVGDWVLAIGSPFGLEQTVTAGIISAKDRVTDCDIQTPFQQFLQTDAAINPGNSGGPLVNLAGEVVGINSQIATNSGFNNGVGLALPSSTFVEVYNQIATSGRVRRGFLGINPQEMSEQIARLNKMTDGAGVVVRDLTSKTGPAASAGLRSGDIITSINGEKVNSVRDLIRRVASLPVGSSATINYVRHGELRTTEVVLEERKQADDEPGLERIPLEPSDLKNIAPKNPPLGINVRMLPPDLARQHGLQGAQSVRVTRVAPGSIADDNDVRENDLIVEMNNQSVTTDREFHSIVGGLKSGDDLVIRLLRKERDFGRRPYIISFTIP